MSCSLPVHLIRQHCFCPRIPYYRELLGFVPPRPEWVARGEALHDRQKRLFRRRTLARFNLQNAEHLFDVPLCSEELGLHGIADGVLLTEERAYPVEVKLSGDKPTAGQILQLTAYAMLCERRFGRKCDAGFILFEQKGKVRPVAAGEKNREKVVQIRDKIRANFLEARLPHSSANAAQCTQCEHLNHCNDRD